MKTEIQLTNIRFRCFHGVYPEEQVSGNDFLVDLKVEVDLCEPMLSDELSDTLDYEQLYRLIELQMHAPVKLLEHLAYKILKNIFSYFPQILCAEIALSKLNPPISGECDAAVVTLKASPEDFAKS